MDRNLFFNLLITSLALGFIFGEIAVIPHVGLVALFLMLFMSAPVALVLLIMLGKLDLTTVKDSIIQGMVAGFFANITFSLGYCITTALIFIIWKYTSNYILSTMIVNSSAWLILMVIIFIGVLTAVTNAFSGFCLYYIINYIRDCYEEKQRKELEKRGMHNGGI